MSHKKTKPKRLNDKLLAQNYCLGFIDLLGQKDLMRGETILPEFNFPNARENFLAKARKSLGAILALQEHAESFINASLRTKTSTEFKRSLSKEQQLSFDKLKETKVSIQRWSDGIVVFSGLENQIIKCPMNGVYRVFMLCGMLCYVGLAGKCPIRGSIEVSWGMELKPDEIYGPVVANTFLLESEVAQYPRIVIGPIAIDYLHKHISEPSDNLYGRANALLAKRCLDMLIADEDGNMIFHYLGKAFQNEIGIDHRRDLYVKSHEFVNSQWKKWREERNSKLAFRYATLLSYFEKYPIESAK